MDFLLQISIVVIVLLIVGLVFLGPIGRHRKRRTGRAHRAKRGWFKKRDHGMRVARQHGQERSSQWSRVRKEHLRREPACVVCGYKGKRRHVHHIKPFHLHPHLELDPHNLMTLCDARGRDHHLLLGHLNEWASYNEHIREDVKRFHRKTAAQIREDPRWQRKVEERP